MLLYYFIFLFFIYIFFVINYLIVQLENLMSIRTLLMYTFFKCIKYSHIYVQNRYRRMWLTVFSVNVSVLCVHMRTGHLSIISRSQTAVWQLDVNHSWSDILNMPWVVALQKVFALDETSQSLTEADGQMKSQAIQSFLHMSACFFHLYCNFMARKIFWNMSEWAGLEWEPAFDWLQLMRVRLRLVTSVCTMLTLRERSSLTQL